MAMSPEDSQAMVQNSQPHMDSALADFLQAYPDFETTRFMDDLRKREFSRLDEQGHIYLDYTGGGLYADAQIRQHADMMRNGVFGNPHSTNPTSLAATELIEEARRSILDYFNASPDEYVAIFTSNATAAIKLVGEAYPFSPGDHYVLTFDNHNSVNGIREFARGKGAEVTYVPVIPPELRIDEARMRRYLDQAHFDGNNLLAYPAQSNFSGVRHSLEWIEEAQSKGWDVMVDCAAFVPTSRLDLSRWHPDFVPMSFYKIFGYPTGIGCLLARRSALAKLERPWFAGGTITLASVQADDRHMAEGEAAFEEGTLNYLGLPAVEIGLRHIESVGIDSIHQRVENLTGWLIDNLAEMRHDSGMPLVSIFGPTDLNMRGGTVTVNFYDTTGKLIGHQQIEHLANQANISLRTGCFCNPGAGEAAHGLTREDMDKAFVGNERMTHEQFNDIIERSDGKTAGAVRISLGIASNFEDVHRFLTFTRQLLNKEAGELPSR
ncbi:MAG: aminotransferase class V-fold PLP-dependent enzyme [SAR202 cluster bacterium]|jgi:selenocysteine lyase/cysteine desulfurase|nr:aminotransferase class V-fold PLP-dependent enzyme [SAR202 cluster bacterium]MDP6713371.1 aminotransferase class V-fold PLP-dependent enzyme [SAR202 cluster bacterium]